MSQWPGGQRPAQPYGQYPQHGAPHYRYHQPYPGGQQPHHGGWPPQPGNQPPKKRRAPLIIAIVVVITAVVATGVIISSFNVKNDDGGLGSGAVTDPRKYGVNVAAGAVAQYATEVAGLPNPGPLTGESLGGVDPRKLYWAMLKRQSMKSVTDYIHMSFVDPESYREQFAGFSRSIIASRVGIDYKGRKFIDENGTINPDGSVRPHQVLIRCDSGTAYDFMPNRGWEPPDPGWNSKSCAERMQPDKFVSNAFTADGVATGGLSGDEADKFISYLDHINGLLTMQQPQAVRGSDGKTYIQLDVTLKPQDPQLPDNAEKLTASGPFFEAAFAQTGKQPSTYPYDFGNGATVGRQMRYYIDPSTLLPAYSVMMATPPITTDGSQASPANTDAGRYTLYEYSFPDQLDPQAMKASGTPIMPFRRWPFPMTLFG